MNGLASVKVEACRKCNRIFQKVNDESFCPVCSKVLAKQFYVVKNYIRNNPDAGLAEVSEECDVEVKQILKWVREERLSFREGSQVALPCMKCGKLIATGEYCPSCKKQMVKNLSSAYGGQSSRDKTATEEVVVHIRKHKRLRFAN